MEERSERAENANAKIKLLTSFSLPFPPLRPLSLSLSLSSFSSFLRLVGDILLPYDSDGMIPVYGFGAKLPPAGEVSHCFPLNGNPSNPEVPGVRVGSTLLFTSFLSSASPSFFYLTCPQGILDAYLQAISNVQLYGPTNFSPAINTSTLIASRHNSQADQKYFILLIITDGEVSNDYFVFFSFYIYISL